MKKQIAIIGTRGIPNQYGGFEQFAEQLSQELVKKNVDVFVYNPTTHPYTKSAFNGVQIIRKKLHEKTLGHLAHLFYDYACLKDSVEKKIDTVLACGYGSMLLAFWFVSLKQTKLIINMDGLEWKRKRWHSLGKLLLKITEKTAVRKGHVLITDHLAINDYFKTKYNIASPYIPYGADIPKTFNETYLNNYNLKPNEYFILISRPVSENNIHTILSGFSKSDSKKKFVIITNTKDKYSKKLMRRYTDKRFVFLPNIYDADTLNTLRHFSAAYFHGHSVGGTNPSLLEAMASECLIIAHDNIFSKTILKENAFYFNTISDVTHHIDAIDSLLDSKQSFVAANKLQILKNYQWEKIADAYFELL